MSVVHLSPPSAGNLVIIFDDTCSDGNSIFLQPLAVASKGCR